jgi:hypothetical protein
MKIIWKKLNFYLQSLIFQVIKNLFPHCFSNLLLRRYFTVELTPLAGRTTEEAF